MLTLKITLGVTYLICCISMAWFFWKKPEQEKMAEAHDPMYAIGTVLMVLISPAIIGAMIAGLLHRWENGKPMFYMEDEVPCTWRGKPLTGRAKKKYTGVSRHLPEKKPLWEILIRLIVKD